ncbi:tetratricopeptide (TPR) repeat protein [Pedobacter africanus]|uniref:Tetratricopeptide (TPR) repeat protein n=1 Tax=Pedobacter africanus TaxID=151894 RepID=A0ACC6KTS5_9SPHI|nr:RagB/SusD family nutrient uptake outer membrane protein [Pedobacter africanus]MDR6782739.1 tetratricopeptide (TPR) repeat protein [Pedobacter africanus]
MKRSFFYTVLSAFLLLLSSCSKEWLEEKQDIKLVIPQTLSDLNLLMNSNRFSYDGRGSSEASNDDFEMTLEEFNSLWYDFERKLITWNIDEFPKLGSVEYQEEWDYPYAQVQACNVALKALEKIQRTESNASIYDRLKGTALYHRARAFMNVAMTFCKYYDPVTAGTDLGIPLKLDENINEPIFRSTLAETYQQITKDLAAAAGLLPENQISVTHITKGGAYALLARTYLYMNAYQHALENADLSLRYHPFLDDYNKIDPAPSYPLANNSKETHIRIEMTVGYGSAGFTSAVPNELYQLYSDNDLRKTLFFKVQNGRAFWRGELVNNNLSGTATDEVLLIGAECAARLNNKEKAMALLNTLLEKRLKTGTFIPLSAGNNEEALDIILTERRKELLKRGLRFQDLKRLNKENRYAKTIVRKIGDKTYVLPPNDKRYVFPIPQYIINYNGIQQNPR